MARLKMSPPTHEEFVFHVRAPSIAYSFGLQHDRRLKETEPFSEHEALHFVTECIWPDRFKDREGKATIYPEPRLADPRGLDHNDVRRKWIGHVRATKGEFEVALRLPPQVVWRLGDAMASGLVRSMLTNGLIEARGLNRVTYASFHGCDFDPVEYVG